MPTPKNGQTTRQAVGRWVVACAIAGTILIGLGAFWLSFTALANLARRSGTAEQLSWVWPLIVDGVIVVATISVVALSSHGTRATRYPWLLLAGGAAVSVAANITHALIAADAGVPPILAALVASVPPVVLLAITHLTVELTRHHHPDPAPAAGQRETPRSPVPKPRGQPRRAASQPRPQITATDRSEAKGDQTAEARRLSNSGLSNRKIAQQLGVHPSTVGRWLAVQPPPDESTAEGSTQGDEHGSERNQAQRG